MYIFLLIILGLALRLINIDKPEGLWNDEYVSWFVASTPFFKGFWQEFTKQCHMPLYYIYLKPFSACNDIILRLTSTIPSIIAIPIMYLTGKQFSRKTGYICATLATILPFIIYYSQEVRFYSLLFLLSAISLYYLIKITNKNKGWVGYTITSLIILLTHVLGIIYISGTLLYLIYKKKSLSIRTIISITICCIILIPIGINIIDMLPSSQWWGKFSYTNILFLFTDYFSPILTNNINAPAHFFYNKNPLFLTLLSLPTILAIFCIIQGIKKAKGLASIVIWTILITSILATTGKLVFITKYTIEIFPILILLFALGIQNRISNVLFTCFITIHLFSIFTPYYPTYKIRTEGHKLVGDILNTTNTNITIFTYYDSTRFMRYIKNDINTISISKTNRTDYLQNPNKYLSKIKKGDTISVVFLNSVSFIPENWIKEAQQRQLPEMFITFSKIRHSLINEINNNYTNVEIKKSGSWTILTAKKFK